MTRYLLAAMLMSLMLGCSSEPPPTTLPTVKMRLGEKQFTLEVADNDGARQRGLMYRDSMPDDHGMIFVFDDAKVLSFWMKNTRIPLDIVYVGADQEVVAIRQMQPFDIRGTSSEFPAQYAIELNQGAARQAGVKVGDKLDIPPLPGQRGPATTQSR